MLERVWRDSGFLKDYPPADVINSALARHTISIYSGSAGMLENIIRYPEAANVDANDVYTVVLSICA
jgi:hypothetical protein